MDYLFVCNSGSDNLSKINLKSFKEEARVAVCKSCTKAGPHGLCSWKGAIITANSYDSSISIVDVMGSEGMEEYYIGGNCNDVAVYKNEAFITCGESNNVVVFDLESKRIIEDIPGGILPHSIDINYSLGYMAICNMENDTVTILDCCSKEVLKNIPVGSYPTRAIFSKDNKYIFVCESYLGNDHCGFINVISTDTLLSIGRIQAGKSPIDICSEDKMCYVVNFSEGYVSFIYLEDMEVVKRTFVGGMPRGIRRKGRFLYIADNYGSQLIKFDIFNNKKEAIAIGKEPIGMTLI
jgi:YVTN family beta-propeller protein